MRIYPACENNGIVFIRNGVRIPAICEYVVNTSYCTILGKSGETIHTIEHLMATIASLMIDNLIIEVNTSEIPIFDGSSLSFVMLFEEAGIKIQNTKKKILRITKPVSFSIEDKWVQFKPYNGIKYNISTEFGHFLTDQHKNVSYQYTNPKTFKNEVSRARTFGFLHEIEQLKQKNLALGGTLDNAILLNSHGMENEEPLRYSDEFVRHKLLDAIGDLRLLGHTFIGEFSGYKPGHYMNTMLCKKVLQNNCYEIIDLNKEQIEFYSNEVFA